MKIKRLSLPGVFLIEPDIFKDERGYFFESFNQKQFDTFLNRKINFVQDNQSFSERGTLRGLHYQMEPYEQAKLVRVTSGEIFDVAVDVRPNSKTFKHWVGEFISSKNNRQLWIPRGYAHGFIVLSETAIVQYKTDNYYSKKFEINYRYDDPVFKIKWPIANLTLNLSDKDRNSKFFDEQ